MTHNMIALMCEIEKKTLYQMEIYRIEQKMYAVGTDSPLFEYLCIEQEHFKEKLASAERFCEYLINEINKEKENGCI